jgi:hypothetical protein
MALFRFPFGNESGWAISQGNWDDNGHNKSYAYDLTHPLGGEIRAARAGMVIDAITDVTVNSWNKAIDAKTGKPICDPAVQGGGNGVLIKHCDGTASTYAHLAPGKIKVQVGSWVAQGQPIALSGDTGCASEPHCHFEVRLSGSSYKDLGPIIAIDFENSSGVGWRPKLGEPVALNNTVLRQDGWRWCQKCQGLFFGGIQKIGSKSVCPFDHQPHSFLRSGNYILNCQSIGPASQKGWRWCPKCQGLFFSLSGASKCPADGEMHSDAGGGYFLADASVPHGQKDWAFCNKCKGLFFAGTPVAGTPGGTCPVDHKTHSGTSSGNYRLDLDQGIEAADIYAPGWRYCNKCQGLFFALHGSSHCPADGSHSDSGGHYFMIHNSPNAPGQEPWSGRAQSTWRRCSKCNGLFFGGKPNVGPVGGCCPADHGFHTALGSPDYRLYVDAPPSDPTDSTSSETRAPGQGNWRYCSKCLGLFFGGASSSGVCPVDKQAHDKAHSGNYTVLQ